MIDSQNGTKLYESCQNRMRFNRMEKSIPFSGTELEQILMSPMPVCPMQSFQFRLKRASRVVYN